MSHACSAIFSSEYLIHNFTLLDLAKTDMNIKTSPPVHPARFCQKCQINKELDSYAIDTYSCQNKHVFFFKCPQCGAFEATSTNNIPEKQWSDFMDEEMLGKFKSELKQATR